MKMKDWECFPCKTHPASSLNSVREHQTKTRIRDFYSSCTIADFPQKYIFISEIVEFTLRAIGSKYLNNNEKKNFSS